MRASPVGTPEDWASMKFTTALMSTNTLPAVAAFTTRSVMLATSGSSMVIPIRATRLWTTIGCGSCASWYMAAGVLRRK